MRPCPWEAWGGASVRTNQWGLGRGSRTNTALRAEYECEYDGGRHLATGNWELTTGEIVAAPIRCPLLFPFRDSACFP
jgi:hypothetical protein